MLLVSRVVVEQLPVKKTEMLKHTMFTCMVNNGAGNLLLTTLRQYQPGLTPNDILTLNFDVEDSLLLPFTWVTASFLSSLFLQRQEGSLPEGIILDTERGRTR